MSDTPPPEPPNLRFLRRLVTGLTAVMIIGLITVVSLLVIRLQAPRIATPETLQLPTGATAHAVTQTPTEWIVTTTDGRILFFAPDGTLTKQLER